MGGGGSYSFSHKEGEGQNSVFIKNLSFRETSLPDLPLLIYSQFLFFQTLVTKCSGAFNSISSQRLAFFSLTLLKRSMIHRCINMEMTRKYISFTFDLTDMLLSL